MTLECVSTLDAAPAVGPYSQAIVISASTSLIYTSGQLPADKDGTIDLSLSVSVQTERCIQNLNGILRSRGSSLAKVIKATVFITNMGDFAEINGVYAKYFTHKPARSCVAVRELPKGVPVEIEVVALA